MWASPVTLVGLLYVMIFQLLGWYKFHSKKDLALIWVTNPNKMPKWLKKLWGTHSFNTIGQAVGNIIVIDALDINPDELHTKYKKLVNHEMVHVRQVMRLGIFQPLLFGANYLAALIIDDVHPYYDNLFEIGARRNVGDVIDVVGYKKQIKAMQDLDVN